MQLSTRDGIGRVMRTAVVAVILGAGLAQSARGQGVPAPELSIDYTAAINRFDTNGIPEWVNAPGVPASESIIAPRPGDVLEVDIDPGPFGDYLAGAARAGYAVGLGAQSVSMLPDSDPDVRRSTSEITASTLRRYIATSDSGSPISIDLNLFADGELGYELTGADPGQPQFSIDHWLTASMELAVIVHRGDGSNQTVWYGSGGLFDIDYVEQPLLTAGDLNDSHFVVQQNDVMRTATLNLAEVFQDEFTVDHGEEFGVEFQLTAKSQNYERYNWTAYADLLNTATLGVQTDDAAAKVLEVTPNVEDGEPNPISDAPPAENLSYIYADARDQGDRSGPIESNTFDPEESAGVLLADMETTDLPGDTVSRGRTAIFRGGIVGDGPQFPPFSFPGVARVSVEIGAEAQAFSTPDAGVGLDGSHALTIAEAKSGYVVGSALDVPIFNAPIDFDFTLHGRLEIGGLLGEFDKDDNPLATASIVAIARAYSEDTGWVSLFDGKLTFDGVTLTREGDFLDAAYDSALANIITIGNLAFLNLDIPMEFLDAIVVSSGDLMGVQLRFEAEAWAAEGYEGLYAISDFYDSFVAGFETDVEGVTFTGVQQEALGVPAPTAAAAGLVALLGLSTRRPRRAA